MERGSVWARLWGGQGYCLFWDGPRVWVDVVDMSDLRGQPHFFPTYGLGLGKFGQFGHIANGASSACTCACVVGVATGQTYGACLRTALWDALNGLKRVNYTFLNVHFLRFYAILIRIFLIIQSNQIASAFISFKVFPSFCLVGSHCQSEMVCRLWCLISGAFLKPGFNVVKGHPAPNDGFGANHIMF